MTCKQISCFEDYIHYQDASHHPHLSCFNSSHRKCKKTFWCGDNASGFRKVIILSTQVTLAFHFTRFFWIFFFFF